MDYICHPKGKGAGKSLPEKGKKSLLHNIRHRETADEKGCLRIGLTTLIMVKHVIKRDGRIVDFDKRKIVDAVLKAMDVTEQGEDIVLAAEIAATISKIEKEDMSVEDIQDVVEMELMNSPRKEVAKKYIAYRNQRNLARKAKSREIFKEIAPEKLYLGCRFARSNPDVLRIAAEYCDVLSYNIYKHDLSTFSLPEGIDKPVIIGEFHFGAKDRGPFHPGLINAYSQEQRGEAYERYVKSALENAYIIGTHWHQFSDQATTGRFDGENFQVGMTDICDRPYYETIRHVRNIGYRMYAVRSGRDS